MEDNNARVEQLESEIEDIIAALKPEGRPKNRSEALAVTKLQEAKLWLRNSLYDND